MSTTTKINYAKETKALLKDSINRLGGELTNLSTFRSYASVLNVIYNALPKVSGTGSNVSLSPTLKGGLDITPIGKCEQDTTSGKNICSNAEVYNATLIRYYVNKPTSKDLTISGKLNVNLNGSLICIVDNENIGNLGSITGTANTTFSKSFTLTDEIFDKIQNGTVIEFRIYEGGQDFTTISEAMLEYGLTFTSYEAYTGGIPSPNPNFPQSVRVVTGDNDVVVGNTNETIQGGVNATGDVTTATNRIRTDYIEIANYNSIVISSNNLSIQMKGIYFYNSSKVYISRISENGYTLPHKISNIPSTAKYFIITYQNQDDSSAINPENNNAFIYQQTTTLHLGSEYLAGIGEYVDTIEGKKDEWKIVRKVKKINGDDYSWTFSVGSLQGYTSAIADIIASQYSGCFCNIGLNNNITQATNSFYVNSGKSLVFRNPTYNGQPITTSNDFNTYIKAIAIFYVKLATPTEETITDQTLISDLNNMYNLMGYDGQTNITIASNSSNAQMTAQVSALKGE